MDMSSDSSYGTIHLIFSSSEEESEDYSLGETMELKNENDFLLTMLKFEKKVGCKLYCLRSDKKDSRKKLFIFKKWKNRN